MMKKKRRKSISKSRLRSRKTGKKIKKRKISRSIKRRRIVKKHKKRKIKGTKRRKVIKKVEKEKVPKKPGFMKNKNVKIKKYKPSKSILNLEFILVLLLVFGLLLTIIPFFYDVEPILFILVGTFSALLSVTGKGFYFKKKDHQRKVGLNIWIKKYKKLVFFEIILIFILAVFLLFTYYFNETYSFALDLSLVLKYIEYAWWFITIVFGLFVLLLYIKRGKKKSAIKQKKVIRYLEKPKEIEKKAKLSSFDVRDQKIIRDIKKGLSEKKNKYKTDLDVLYNVIKNNKKVSVEQVATGFGINKEKSEKWGKILEGRGLVKIKYGLLGSVEIWKK